MSFRLNHETKTKVGEVLTPFLVEGTTVYCFGKNGRTIIKNINEFDFGPEKMDNMIIVNPPLEIDDELFENEVIIVPPPPPANNIIEIPTKTSKDNIPIEEKIVDKGISNNEEYV